MSKQFGATNWKDKQTRNFPPREGDDLPKIPFMRLQQGSNYLRIVTIPYKYHFIRYAGPNVKSPFGVRVNCAYPLYDNDPATGMGYPAKLRYFVGVIDRREGDLKILDMSTVIMEKLQDDLETLEEMDGQEHSPTEFDINVRYNKNASSPGATYNVVRGEKAALSEEDVALINAIGEETLNKVLLRHATPPKPEVVVKLLEKHGWVEGEKAPPKEDKKDAKKKGDENLSEAKDDDYSFEKPKGGDDAEATTEATAEA
jgi:hypothetical protein